MDLRTTGWVTAQLAPLSVPELLQKHLALWYSCERGLPEFPNTITERERTANDRQLNALINGLLHELKHPALTHDGQREQQQRLRAAALPFLRDILSLDQAHMDFIENSGMLEAAQEFAGMARAFDPSIRAQDIYQASRNVMTMNFLQILLGLPVAVTPSVFAYSMLYPYTDNYLDDPAVSANTKLAFNHRFAGRLHGETIHPANPAEETISQLVTMIEGQWDRARSPQVYESLLAIHTAQARSMRLVAPGAGPYELDVLGISFEKGGTSVLADGYLVTPGLTSEQAQLMFGYGSFTQLMDDLEDLEEDRAQGSMSIFSQAAGHWPLDGMMNRVFRFGRKIFADLSAFPSPDKFLLESLMQRCIDVLLIDSAGQMQKYFRRDYIRTLEQHFPFHFSVLARQRARLQRQKLGIGRLFEVFFVSDQAGERLSSAARMEER